MELESRNYETLPRDRRFVTWLVDRAPTPGILAAEVLQLDPSIVVAQ